MNQRLKNTLLTVALALVLACGVSQYASSSAGLILDTLKLLGALIVAAVVIGGIVSFFIVPLLGGGKHYDYRDDCGFEENGHEVDCEDERPLSRDLWIDRGDDR